MNYKVNTFTRENAVTATVNTTATLIALRDPKRVLLIASNLSGNTGFLGVNDLVSSTRGIQIVTGGNFVLTKKDHYDLLQDELWAINNVAGGTWWFLEQIMIPDQYREE